MSPESRPMLVPESFSVLLRVFKIGGEYSLPLRLSRIICQGICLKQRWHVVASRGACNKRKEQKEIDIINPRSDCDSEFARHNDCHVGIFDDFETSWQHAKEPFDDIAQFPLDSH